MSKVSNRPTSLYRAGEGRPRSQWILDIVLVSGAAGIHQLAEQIHPSDVDRETAVTLPLPNLVNMTRTDKLTPGLSPR